MSKPSCSSAGASTKETKNSPFGCGPPSPSVAEIAPSPSSVNSQWKMSGKVAKKARSPKWRCLSCESVSSLPMRDACRNQWLSVAISGYPRSQWHLPAGSVRGHQGSSVAISGYPRSSVALACRKRPMSRDDTGLWPASVRSRMTSLTRRRSSDAVDCGAPGASASALGRIR